MILWFQYAVVLVLQIIGFSLFLIGFFPQKSVLPGFNQLPIEGSPFLLDGKPAFDTFIFIVVDALRADFMYSNVSLMHFLHSLVRDGSALPYTAYAHPPTVTLPRLKGITTGGTPSFIDAVFNVADDNDNSQGLSNVDSWLYQFKNSDRKGVLHFFGDDTWLKLFPGKEFFEKYEGTDSFFVSDFTEVDTNVTRHLDSEIANTSWDGLILHYLGLDHIGHKSGPKSIYMKAKQEEMDSVLQKLYETRVATSDSTLLVIMGDHGMNELGNHGGSSEGETSPGLLLASPIFKKTNEGKICPQDSSMDYKYYSQMSQIDIVPTLAALFNFAIPINNIGVIIPEVLNLWPEISQRKRILLENCRQLMTLLKQQQTLLFAEQEEYKKIYLSLLDIQSNSCESYYLFLKAAQSLLAGNSTNYLFKEIFSGYFLVVLGLFCSLFVLLRTSRFYSTIRVALFLLFCVAYALHFHGSSLIEEEHQIWWFLTSAVFSHTYFLGQTSVYHFLIQLVSLRLIRSWNNTGQKFSTVSTMSNALLNHSLLNWILVVLTYMLVIFKGRNPTNRDLPANLKGFNFVSKLWLLGIVAISVWFKVIQYIIDGKTLPPILSSLVSLFDTGLSYGKFDKVFYQGVSTWYSRLFFLNILLFVLSQLAMSKTCLILQSNNVVSAIIILLIHQTRTEVIPIFIVFALLEYSIHSGPESDSILSVLTYLCIQNLSFFSVGNTNLLATVDLSNAYNGVSEYNIVIVTLLTFVSNFSGVLFWLLSQISQLSVSSEKWKTFYNMSCLKLIFYLISMSSLIGSCINLRYHLFIWSVFSPKLLFFAVWVLLVNVLVELFFGGIFLISI